MTTTVSVEQRARDLLERLEHPHAQEQTAGNLVELTNLISARDRLLKALKALVQETERCDRPGDYGVGSEAELMVQARDAIEWSERYGALDEHPTPND